LVEDDQLSLDPGAGQVRGMAGEQRPVLERRAREPGGEGGQVRCALFD
jgi:hypothetical protein